jgi:hypothetical protein
MLSIADHRRASPAWSSRSGSTHMTKNILNMPERFDKSNEGLDMKISAPTAIPSEVVGNDAANQLASDNLVGKRSLLEKTDTVQLSAEAIALLMSQNAVTASIEVIKTENGVGKPFMNILR